MRRGTLGGLALCLLAASALAWGQTVQNGGFEDSPWSLDPWVVVDWAGSSGSWFVQSGNTSPYSGFPVPLPPEGSQAAMSDQVGWGSHLLCQEITFPMRSDTEWFELSFDLFIGNRAGIWIVPATLDPFLGPNQQVRVDIVDPSAPPFDVGAGVLANLYSSQPGDPPVSGYTRLHFDLSGFAGQTVILRFAEVDNQLFMNMGVDNVEIATIYSIQRAIDAASPGDTIHVGPGTYVENLLVDKTLTILGGGGQYVKPFQLGDVIRVTADGVTIDGLDVSEAMAWYLGMRCDGIKVTADNVTILRSVVHDNASEGIEVHGNAATIAENVVSDNGVVPEIWGFGVLILGDLATVADNLVTDNWSGIGVVGDGGAITGNVVSGTTALGIAYQGDSGLITGNTVTGNEQGISVYPGAGTIVAFNDVSGNHDGLDVVGSTDTVLRYNAIEGNNPAGDPGWGGLWVAPYSPRADAILNWWGSVDGPTQDIEGDGIAEYDGGGDWVIGPAVFSPWLGIDPDGDAGSAGVQLVSPMLLIVDDVGPPPAAGYLNAAITAANSTMLPGVDTIEVRHGTYDASEPITDALALRSETGSAGSTHLLGNLSLDASNILIGGFRNGFTVHGNVGVLPGVDASTIHLNWSDLLGLVDNQGLNTMDATYNWWGGNHPQNRIIGFVDYYPWLRLPSDTIIRFIDQYGLEVAEALTLGELIAAGLTEDEALVALEVMLTCGYSLQEAITLVKEVGWLNVASALRRARGDCEQFAIQIAGYGFVAGAGGVFSEGGGGATGKLTYEVGETMLVYFQLTHPITGEVIPDAVVSVAVSHPTAGDLHEIVFFDVVPFDPETGQYEIEVATTDWELGVYDVWIGTGALDQFEHTQVTLVAPAE